MTGLHVAALVLGISLMASAVTESVRQFLRLPSAEPLALAIIALLANATPFILIGGALIWWGAPTLTR